MIGFLLPRDGRFKIHLEERVGTPRRIVEPDADDDAQVGTLPPPKDSQK